MNYGHTVHQKMMLRICLFVNTNQKVYIVMSHTVNNVILIGATGRQNKTVRKQVSLELESKGVTINIICLVAIGLPFEILIGCDMLRKYSAIIDLSKEKVSLNSEGVMWTAELIGCLLYTSRCV